MYPCPKKINKYAIFSIFIVSLSSLCAYCITEYMNSLQLGMLNITDIPQSYRILFKVSSSIASVIPIVIFLFLFFSSEIMFNDLFGEEIEKYVLLKILGISFIPMLIYQYFFWFNILIYCNTISIKEVSDFVNMTFMYGLTLEDFGFINLICWGCVYLVPVVYFIYKEVNFVSTIVSFLLPSFLTLFFYYILTE